jgi:hypothetical protein
MGCDQQGTVSVLYAKPATVRLNSKSKPDKFSMTHKANSSSSPTIIFKGPRYLKYFLDHASRFLQPIFPSLMVGHSGDDLPKGGTYERYQEEPPSVQDYMSGKKMSRYLSNGTTRFDDLVTNAVVVQPPEVDCFQAITHLLSVAHRQLDPMDFHNGFEKLVRKFGVHDKDTAIPPTEATNATRYSSPKRTLSETYSGKELSQMAISGSSSYTARRETMRQMRTVAHTGLDYTYSDGQDMAGQTGNKIISGQNMEVDTDQPPAHIGTGQREQSDNNLPEQQGAAHDEQKNPN